MMKKLVLAMLLAVVSLLGVSNGSVCEAADNGTVGFVALDAVFENYPGIADAQKAIRDEQQKLQQEFDAKAAELSEADRANLQRELNIKLAQKQLEVMQPIQKKIADAVAKVAKEKEIKQVVKAEVMLFGGVDLTKDVIAAIKE